MNKERKSVIRVVPVLDRQTRDLDSVKWVKILSHRRSIEHYLAMKTK